MYVLHSHILALCKVFPWRVKEIWSRCPDFCDIRGLTSRKQCHHVLLLHDKKTWHTPIHSFQTIHWLMPVSRLVFREQHYKIKLLWHTCWRFLHQLYISFACWVSLQPIITCSFILKIVIFCFIYKNMIDIIFSLGSLFFLWASLGYCKYTLVVYIDNNSPCCW